MRKIILIFFILIFTLGCVINSFAQQIKADKYFENLAYTKAIKYYKKANKKDPHRTPERFLRKSLNHGQEPY